MYTSYWDGWGAGTFVLAFNYGVNRHSRVVCSITELGGPPGGPLDWPFIGNASMQVLNVAPSDDGNVYVRMNVAWDSTLQWRLTFFIDP